ncbi:MAG: amino acid permease [Bacteroidota bacterium]
MSSAKVQKFGTAPVFFTAISTILGAVMFLRFGFAVGQVGLLGTMAIILVGHAITIPTAMAIAEIATNQKVEGGGEYYIISRSFGLVIGSSIGIALFFSQAISVAFYIIAFSEAFSGLFDYLLQHYHFPPTVVWLLEKKQTVSIPALLILTAIVLIKGADLGVKALYVVVCTLFFSLVAFFMGETEYAQRADVDIWATISDPVASAGGTLMAPETTATLTDPIAYGDSLLLGPITSPLEVLPARPQPMPEEDAPSPISPLPFFAVFAIIFPAFTGMTAGVGLSGDLANPRRSIPLGTLAGTLSGMVVYVFIAIKLASSASPADLADTSHLVMADIAWQGWWLIPVGLAAATVSSALGSILVAPRTLQAIARDKIFPSTGLNYWLSRGRGATDEPYNATVVTVGIALIFVLIGGLDFVAEIISMFFMVTYGSLCLISFLQHFAADPAYRPTFRSRWYVSLFGALACFGLIFIMNAAYALLALLVMVGFYVMVSYYNPDKRNLALIFQGVIFQLSRQLQVFVQKAKKEQNSSWRPSVVCISANSFERFAAFDFLSWVSYKYGFGTYIHKIEGYLSKATNREAREAKERLIKMSEASRSNVYIDTLVSPSYTSAIAQVIQLPGISGTDNNLLMFEYSKSQPDNVPSIVDNFKLIKSVNFDVIVLGSSQRGFGFKRDIHIWISPQDFVNANLMILLGYIVLGHPDWQGAMIKIFAIFPEETCSDERDRLFALIEAGQLPISPHNIQVIPQKPEIDSRTIISDKSRDADLTIVGFRSEQLKHSGPEVFERYAGIGNTVFVNAAGEKTIK